MLTNTASETEEPIALALPVPSPTETVINAQTVVLKVENLVLTVPTEQHVHVPRAPKPDPKVGEALDSVAQSSALVAKALEQLAKPKPPREVVLQVGKHEPAVTGVIQDKD